MQMNQNTNFSYNYSAKENKEVREIRQKYLPREESKMEELKRLDHAVQTSGIAEALCMGVIGSLVFGIGMCLGMQVIANGIFAVVTGVLVSGIGICAIIGAFPLYRRVYAKTKSKLAPRILELTAELLNEKL